MKRQHYADIEKFKVNMVRDENGKFIHFVVVDRNGELALKEKFELASEAIEAGYKKFKELGSLF